ncbi:MAG: tetratricopeptide repeat protein [Caldilineaceae bacterium]
MSKKNRQKQKIAHKQQQQKANRPAARLQLAEEALNRGDFDKAAAAAELALKAGNDAATQQRGRVLLAEATLRQLPQKLPQAQLQLLDHALSQAPDDVRLSYHHGLALGHLARFEDAATAFQTAHERQPDRPGLAYLLQLTKVAAGKTADGKGLTEPQRATLQLLQQLRKTKSGEQTLAKLNGQPLPANSNELWAVLLQMHDSDSSVPVATYAKASADATVAANPVTVYYQGVLAMRQREPEAAATAWRTASRQLATPWLLENLRNLRRERATELAGAGEWQAVIDLYQQTLDEIGGEEMDAVFTEVAGHAHFQLGFAAGQSGNWQLAYRHFQQADELMKNRWLSQNYALAAEALEQWETAATAWREMVRRRPRKQDHPDYLSDAQVAAIWSRIAHCYVQDENLSEAITCLKNAVKYNEQNLTLRITLADLLHAEGRIEAAENELDRILELDANHVPALTRLGALYTDRWDRDPMPIWQRVLALEPTNEDARTALAMLYVQQAGGGDDAFFGFRTPMRTTGKKTPIQILEEGLTHVPNHPILLVELGRRYHEKKKNKEAREQLMQAARVAPKDVMILGAVLHELLHADGGDQVRELIPQVRTITGLRPSFWVSQGEQVLQCELGAKWAQLFWDQAIAVAQAPSASARAQGAPDAHPTRRGEDSPAATLLRIYDAAEEHGEEKLTAHYADRLRKEHPKSGAIEYIDASRLWLKDPKKTDPILRLLSKAKTTAQKAGEPEIAEMAETFERNVKYPQRPSLFGGRNPFLELLGGLDDDDDDIDIDEDDLFNAFRRAFR